MSLEPRTLLSHYRLVEKIGEGGMGVVWKATDTSLDRSVAIKILPEIFSEDPERLARFEREAKLLASLNHPNIATIHGLHHEQGIHFLAMELVEGEDLAARLKRGAVPPEDAFEISLQVAAALEAAHEAGVIHRDLKPANIQITPEGKVKVLDFGLAKALAGEDPVSGAQSLSPTITSLGTRAGMILGTAGYMSPEQARGRAVDRRADIWAFGCVLYEMLTGESAFVGETVSDTLASILKSEPDWTKLEKRAPASALRLIRSCLQKDPRRRLQAIGDARIGLEEIQAGKHEPSSTQPISADAPHPHPLVRALPWAVAAAAVAAALWALTRPPAPSAPQLASSRLNIDLSTPNRLLTELGSAIVLSPDGRQIAYVADTDNGRQLFLRRLDQLTSSPLAGTNEAYGPFFSPDGTWIGYFAGSKLQKVQVSGGIPMNLADVSSSGQARGGTWGRGVIVFAHHFEAGLSRISESGGKAEPLTTPDPARKERSHRWPSFLPDGRHVLFAVQGGGKRYDDGEIDVVSVDTGERKKIYEGGAYPRYAASGHLLFVKNETLFAVPFDADRLEVTGSPRAVIDYLASSAGDQEAADGSAQYDVAPSGTLVYRSTALGQNALRSSLSMMWVDLKGAATPVTPEKRAYYTPAVSPDGRRIAVSIEGATGLDLWVYEIARGAFSRLTFKGTNSYPLWSPDGKKIAFSSLTGGSVPNIVIKRSDGVGEAEKLHESANAQVPSSWSPDGKTLAYLERFPETRWDIMTINPGNGSPPAPFLQSKDIEAFPAFSPDGRWLAYASDETGQFEIYVTAYPGPGGKWQVSTDGGQFPRWTSSGELFYLKGERFFEVRYSATGESFQAEKPRELFRYALGQQQFAPNYDAAPDGKRFLIFSSEGEEARMALTHAVLAFDWLSDLKKDFSGEQERKP
ncbi:MAG TPA: protein kinase [Candidatus Polarisedimenticolia bacterium]|nr:protein kinase [Candidatus Polarisedimenticolia bacterium]